jgi:hypothetical protein
MTRFYGKVGYGHNTDKGDGVWEDAITERELYGDVVKNTRRLITGADLNSDLTTGNSISVLADTYALDNIFAIRYVEWAGTLWDVIDVEEQRPRLLLRLGGVYNGPRPEVATPNPQGSTG